MHTHRDANTIDVLESGIAALDQASSARAHSYAIRELTDVPAFSAVGGVLADIATLAKTEVDYDQGQ